MCQFAECHRTLHFHDTHISLPITRADAYKRARPKVEEEGRLSLEARRISEEEEENVRLESEEEARLVEVAMLKYEEEKQARMRDDKEARLA